MPPEIISEVLRPAVHFPLTEHFEGEVVEQKDAAGSFAIGRPERADIDAFRSAVNRVKPGVASATEDFVRFDHLDDFRIERIRLGVHYVDAGRFQSWHNQIAAFDVGMGCVGAKRRAAGVPAEMMKLVTRCRHFSSAHQLPGGGCTLRQIHYGHCVGLAVVLRVEDRYVSQLLLRRLHSQSWRWIESWIRFPLHHVRSPVFSPGLESPAGTACWYVDRELPFSS